MGERYHLLTGATGLLGRYLLRDLTLAEVPLAVVVRKSQHESAMGRIETAMAHWEHELGRTLIRPIVLEGDISQADLGMSSEDVQWVGEFCDTVVHSAASLTFYATDSDGEPWRSNVTGTRHVLDLCQKTGIRKFHYVSTAYVCGQRRGLILEDELDVGQEPSNDYEQSKITAEKEVVAAEFLDVVTVHRPSIIVGDSQTGFTTSYHGFYTPLRLIHTVATSVPWDAIVQGDWLGGLALSGDERKNLVPVEWVSAAMTEVIRRPDLHGHTYHFTNPAPTTVADMLFSIATAVSKLADTTTKSSLSAMQVEEMIETFRDQMKVYESYWSDDPTFDSSRTESSMPHLPCPVVDASVMDGLVRYALDKNFGWPREVAALPKTDVAKRLTPWIEASRHLGDVNGARRYINLCVNGSGGGQWHMLVDHDRLVGLEMGLRKQADPTCYMNAETFASLTQGQLSWNQAVSSGRLVVSGSAMSLNQLARYVLDLENAPYSESTD